MIWLHKGEAILTKEENDARKRGSFSGTAEMEQALEDAIERSMSRMYLNMNGQKVADFTAKRTSQVISTNERARIRSMGG